MYVTLIHKLVNRSIKFNLFIGKKTFFFFFFRKHNASQDLNILHEYIQNKNSCTYLAGQIFVTSFRYRVDVEISDFDIPIKYRYIVSYRNIRIDINIVSGEKYRYSKYRYFFYSPIFSTIVVFH